jgi:sulfatase maturation enzyme AslB (radical SAM superfamily)
MTGHDYVLMLTQRCNLRCTYCYQRHTSVDQELEVIERLATFLHERPGRRSRVVFHGGEPLLRRDLLRRGVELLTDVEGVPICDFGIVTNGTLIDDETIELFGTNRFDVSVSFDGCREAQAFRDAATFDVIVANLERLVPFDAAGLLRLNVAMTVTLDNLPYLGRSVAFLTELGVPNVTIEGELYGPWVAGSERLVEEEVEDVVRQMEARVAAGLPVPVERLQPRPHDPAGTWWETDEERAARREERLGAPECNCGAAGASVIHADGSSWACPLYVPDLGRMTPERLAAPGTYRFGSWLAPDLPVDEAELAVKREAIRAEPIMAPKRGRHSIFGECATCPHVSDCSACPAASHLPDAEMGSAEVPPLLCALNMAFLSRQDRMRRPPVLMDVLLAVASGAGRA